MKAIKDIAYDAHYEACKLDLYLPDDTCGQVPLFMYIHGGGLESLDKADANRVRIAEACTRAGIAMASINYRMYPTARFPEYIEDSAAAVAFLMKEGNKWADLGAFAIGGESAGGYLTQMLYFDHKYLDNAGADRSRIRAFVMDAGQPTTHFNILKYERGVDPRRVVIDEASALYHLAEEYTNPEAEPYVAIFAADNDIVNRYPQNKVLETAMIHLGFPREKLLFHLFENCTHCAYVAGEKYLDIVLPFLARAFAQET